jgi:hypothetical protein
MEISMSQSSLLLLLELELELELEEELQEQDELLLLLDEELEEESHPQLRPSRAKSATAPSAGWANPISAACTKAREARVRRAKRTNILSAIIGNINGGFFCQRKRVYLLLLVRHESMTFGAISESFYVKCSAANAQF